MLRYVLSVPRDITAEEADRLRLELADIVGQPGWRDIVLARGFAITDMRRLKSRPSFGPYRPALLR